MPLTQQIKNRILSALNAALANTNRSEAKNKSPNFAPVYAIERKEINEAIAWAAELAPQEPAGKK